MVALQKGQVTTECFDTVKATKTADRHRTRNMLDLHIYCAFNIPVLVLQMLPHSISSDLCGENRLPYFGCYALFGLCEAAEL